METLIVFFWKVKDEWNARNYATLQKKKPIHESEYFQLYVNFNIIIVWSCTSPRYTIKKDMFCTFLIRNCLLFI